VSWVLLNWMRFFLCKMLSNRGEHNEWRAGRGGSIGHRAKYRLKLLITGSSRVLGSAGTLQAPVQRFPFFLLPHDLNSHVSNTYICMISFRYDTPVLHEDHWKTMCTLQSVETLFPFAFIFVS